MEIYEFYLARLKRWGQYRTNVQTKLIALHDLDVPWRPSDVEQSEVARRKALITGLSQKILTQAQALDCCR